MDMDLEQKAIMRLREAADTSERFYKAPLIVTTSGGKDSSVCVALAEKAGIDFEVMHNHTTVDARFRFLSIGYFHSAGGYVPSACRVRSAATTPGLSS